MTGAQVQDLYGAPDRRSELLFQGATGTYTTDWEYDDLGLQIGFASDEESENTLTVASLSATSSSSLITRRGIAPGASEQQVRDAYGDVIDNDESLVGELLVAGSLYGGVIFVLHNGRVQEIFIGAAAE